MHIHKYKSLHRTIKHQLKAEKSQQLAVNNVLKMPSMIIIFVLLSVASIHSLPIKKNARHFATAPSSVVTMSSSVWNMLTDIEPTSKGLYPVSISADFLTINELFTPEVTIAI